MPKRKKDTSYDSLLRKLRKLDKKIRRRCDSRSRSPSSENRRRGPSESPERERSCLNTTQAVHTDHLNSDEPGVPTPTLPVEPVAPGHSQVIGTDETPSGNSATAGTDDPVGPPEIVVDGELDDTILQLLGDDPTATNTFGAEIHKDLTVRLEHIATNGLNKDTRKELNEKYLIPSNCKLIDAPTLNAEMKAAVSDMTLKRDKSIEFRQKQNATAISCLSAVMNKLLSQKDSDPAIIQMVMDTERILCDLQHHDSTIRRGFILSAVKKDTKDQLQNTKLDQWLFGKDLNETLKSAKAISKSGADLKVTSTRPIQNATKRPPGAAGAAVPGPSSTRNLNWKGPFPPRKQPTYQSYSRTKDPHPPQNRSRPYNSSKPSQQHQARARR